MSRFPYAGLRPFDRHEVDIFFGRDQQVYELLERLGQTHFLAVLGASGCGKSSLVRTGLLPSLDSGFLTCAGSNWRLAEMRPGNKPFENLSQVLLEALGSAYTAAFHDKTQAMAFLQVALQRGAGSIGEILRESPLPEKTNLLLLIDQFEEIFRYRATEQATAFVWLLLESCRLPNVYVIITMRSDFLSDCSHFLGLPEVINQGLYLTPRLSREQLRDAIELPAIVFNSRVDAALCNRLLNDVGNNPDQLPLLQHVLMQMWRLEKGKSLSLEHYAQIGGLENALSNHVETIFNRLTANQQRLAEVLFRSLCERGDTQCDIRRPVRLDEVAALAEVECSKVIEVIDEFRKEGRSFLTPSYPQPLLAESMIDISHESLIRQWWRLKEWVTEESKSATIYQRLEKNALLWHNNEHGFYRTPELENALSWQQTQNPTPLWARRYGQHFDLAMSFLKQSFQEQQKKIAEQQTLLQAEQARKFKQVRSIAFATGCGLLVMSLLAGWAWWERHNARLQTQQIIQLETQHITELFQALLVHAGLLAKSEDYAGAKQVLEKTLILDAKLDANVAARQVHARNLLSSFVQMLGAGAEQIYNTAGYPLFSVAVSPDGKLLASAGENGALVIFEVKTGKLLQRLAEQSNHTGETQDTTVRHVRFTVKRVLFTPQGDKLLSTADDRKLIIWQRQQNSFIQQTIWTSPEKIVALAMSPDGKTLAIGTANNQITLSDIATNQIIRTLTKHTASIAANGLTFNATGDYLASAFYDNTAIIWRVATGEMLHILKGHTSSILSVAFSPDGTQLATGSDDKTIRLWDIASETSQAFVGHQKGILALHFVGNGEQLVSASIDRDIRIWDSRSGVTLRFLQEHNAAVSALTSYAGHLFSASKDGTLRRWALTLPYQQSISVANEPVSAAISPDLQHVAVGFQNGALHLYDSSTGHPRWEKNQAHNTLVTRLTFNKEGNLLASASADSTAKIWQFNPALPTNLLSEQKTLSGHTDTVNAVTFSPDSSTVATASDDGSIGLFPLQGQKSPVFITPAHNGNVSSVSFSKTGQQLLSGGRDIKLWSLQPKPLLLKSFPKASSFFWSTLSPDSHYTASVGRDQVIEIYNIESGQLKYVLDGHQQAVFKSIFSPDSLQLASVGDTSIRFWNLDKGNALFTLRLPTKDVWPAPIWDFDFRCADGQCLVAAPLVNKTLVLYHLFYDKQWSKEQADDIQGNLSLWQSYLKLVTTLHRQKAVDASLQAQREADVIGEVLMYANPYNVTIQRLALHNFLQQAELHKSLPDLPAALTAYEKAIAVSEFLLKQSPSDLQSQAEIFAAFSEGAACLEQSQQPAQANLLYQRLFALPLNFVHLLIERIAVAEKQGATDIANQDVQSVLQRVNKTDAEELHNVGYALARLTSRYNEAYPLLQQALRLRPENATTLDSIGWLLHKMGKNQESLSYLLQAKKQLPNPEQDPAELAWHLTEVLWELDRKTEARAVLLEALQTYPDAHVLQDIAKKLQIPPAPL
jgi:WD40 repeat protein